MTAEEAIKYLQQLYPNGGHCWLDEQRIEAIGMAVKALKGYGPNLTENIAKTSEKALKQREKEGGPKVSEDLEEAAHQCYEPNDKFMEGFKKGANWHKEQMMTKAVGAQCFGFQGAALFSFRLPASNYLVGSEVKVIVIKED